MAESTVSLVNQALLLLSSNTVLNIDAPTSALEAQCQTIYGPTRDALLVDHPWNFAITRQALNPIVAVPVYGWTKAFALPTDPPYLRALDTNWDSTWSEGVSWWWQNWPPQASPLWQIESINTAVAPAETLMQRVLVANDTTLSLRYIYRVTDPTHHTPAFDQALVYRLAARLCYALNHKEHLVSVFWQAAEKEVQRAKDIDGQEGHQETWGDDSLIVCRF